MKDAIANSLGVTPIAELKEASEVTIIESTAIDVTPDEQSYAGDIEEAQTKIKGIIAVGEDILEEIVELAKQSEKARDYEVAAGIMKTLIDASKDLVDLSKKKYDSKTTPNNTTNVVNNNLVLSTADLLKMLKGETK